MGYFKALTVILSIFLMISCSNKTVVKEDTEIFVTEADSSGTVIRNGANSEIDSLYFLVDSLLEEQTGLYNIIDSLSTELAYYESVPLVDLDFEIPSKYNFAGYELDLTGSRTAEKFEKIFRNELRAAHRYIPLSGRYFPYFKKVFKEHGIPEDLIYLSIAESMLKPHATSHAGAAGIWQFMGSTAKGYDLKMNSYIDERRHILKSTKAAAKLLKDNYHYLKRYGIDDWLLAMCAYNAGVGNVLKDAKGQGACEFSNMIMRVEETDLYVYRSIAIKMIFDNQEKLFGKKFIPEESFEEKYKSVTITSKGHHQIKEWAVALGTNIAEITEINPWIRISKRKRRRYTPLNEVIIPPGVFEILIPKGRQTDQQLLAKANAELLKETARHYVFYTVRSGDNLSNIARKHGTSIYKLKRLNGLRSNTIYPGQKLKVRGDIHLKSSQLHIVQSGENLGLIAKKYGMSVSNLKRMNNLKRNMIFPGQKLVISKSKEQVNVASGTHTVRKGDSLSEIADLYGTSVQSIISLNSLKNNTIYPGQELKVKGTVSSSSTQHHIVKSGENLGLIAKNYGITISELKAANNLSSNIIHPGQKLTVKTDYLIYTVRKGDNLSTIAKKFNTSVSGIKKSNRLRSDMLSIGQKLKIIRQ